MKDLTNDKNVNMKNVVELAAYKGYHLKQDEPNADAAAVSISVSLSPFAITMMSFYPLQAKSNKWKNRIMLVMAFVLAWALLQVMVSGQMGGKPCFLSVYWLWDSVRCLFVNCNICLLSRGCEVFHAEPGVHGGPRGGQCDV